MRDIKKLSLHIIILTIVIWVSVFSFSTYTQLNRSAQIMIDSGRKELASLAYTIAKQAASYEDIRKLKPLIDRTNASNDILKAIFITDDEKVLVTTDYHYQTLPDPKHYLLSKYATPINVIKKENILHQKVYFHIKNKRHSVHLFIVLDFDRINAYLDDDILRFFYITITMASLYFLIIVMLFRKLLLIPLEQLHQYAIHHLKTPQKFFLNQLEAIRTSMKQTFQRLEEDKKELIKLARIDPLTQLPNRVYLGEKVHSLINRSQREGKEFAFLFLDFDHFKDINDSLGHDMGDKFLKEAASTLKHSLRDNDIIGRVGGDEFVIVINEYTSLMEVTQAVERIRENTGKTFMIDNHALSLTCSIGIATYPKDATDMTGLMQHADIAMYQAKMNGRDQYHFFTEELNEKVQEQLTLSREMKTGFQNKEFELYYQPQIDIKNNTIVACEALIRWNHPTRGLINPSQFMTLAEQNGFIVELGHWILQEAIRQQVFWREQNICDIRMAVNISVKQIFHKDFEKILFDMIKKSNISTDKLEIEIVESVFIEHTSAGLYLLHKIKKLGISIALDDFGTGYSSLSYLQKFPIDILKIDKTFIDKFQNKSDSIFLETIMKMGRTLGLKVLCEGVESKEQLAYLTQLDCDMYQGHLYSKALNARDFEALISSLK